MNSKTYSIFGAGAAGLYTAWRLVSGTAKTKQGKEKLLGKGDVLELYDWGKYDFSKKHAGTREAGARICTWHYKNDKTKSYLELGGMRYAEFNPVTKAGHCLVTKVIKDLGLDKYSVQFNESSDQLLYLRSRNMYLNEIGLGAPAPYNIAGDLAAQSPYNGFSTVQNLSKTPNPKDPKYARLEWCKFYTDGKLTNEVGKSSVFKNGDLVKDVGYWNLMYDQLGSEGYNYTADANGYASNVINWNSAVAFNSNNEFSPGTQYKTLTLGYSSMFNALFEATEKLAKAKGIVLKYFPNTRLHSILAKNNNIEFGIATREKPWQKTETKTTDAVWLAMPRYAIDLVAQATRFQSTEGLDVLNAQRVKLYLESVVMQPSYKVGLFFDTPWWLDNATYPPKLTSFVVNDQSLAQLKKMKWSSSDCAKLKADTFVYNQPFSSEDAFALAVSNCLAYTISYLQQGELFTASKQNNTIGPSFTDTPVRMAVYFGNNALDQKGEKVYGMLASYDDEQFTTFWKGLEQGPKKETELPESENCQPLDGPRKVPKIMVNMLRKQLAEMHYGPGTDYTKIPEPLDAAYMDWSLPPFNAGYHAWAAHYDIGDVQRNIRKPTQLINNADADIFIVGEAYSNDQAWVEGAYCTSESVLNDFLYMDPIVNDKYYPFICPK